MVPHLLPISDKKKALTFFFFFVFFFVFFLVLSLFYRSQMVNFKEIYHFSRFQGVQLFSGGSNFFPGGGGSDCLFPIETHITCDFPGGSGPPVPPSLWIRTCLYLHYVYYEVNWCKHRTASGWRFKALSAKC